MADILIHHILTKVQGSHNSVIEIMASIWWFQDQPDPDSGVGPA